MDQNAFDGLSQSHHRSGRDVAEQLIEPSIAQGRMS